METTKKRIYSYLIKSKIILFLLFFCIAIMIYFISIYYKNIPIVISFVLICFLYAIINYSNFIYAAYLYKISNLKEKDLEEEVRGIYFLAILSFPIMFITGIIMSLLLQSPNYTAGYLQIFLLFSLFIILNEFFIVFKAGAFHKNIIKKDYSKIKGQTPVGFIILLIMENIGAIFTLISVALRFEFPTNIFSLLSLLLFVGVMSYLCFKIIKKSRHVD